MLKSNGSGIKVWILEAVVGFIVIILLSVGGWWFASANDTLRTAVTTDSLDKTLIDRGLTHEAIGNRIQTESPYVQSGSKEKIENTAETVKEIKDDFREFKRDQDAKLKEFSENQTEMMKLMIRMNAKMEKDS